VVVTDLIDLNGIRRGWVWPPAPGGFIWPRGGHTWP